MTRVERRIAPGATSRLFWLVPVGLTLFLLLLLPLLIVFRQSFWSPEFSLRHYQHVFGDTTYLRIILNTLEISVVVTMLCGLLAYPVAVAVNSLPVRAFKAFRLVLSLPLWVNPLAIIYSWVAILQQNGLVNKSLESLGLISVPIQLLYNLPGVVIIMVYLLLPYMVFPILSSLASLDRSLLMAARNLGAGPAETFRRVVFPLSLPGLAAGTLLVFVSALGYFVTPALVGGRKETMISMVIADTLRTQSDWGFACALTVVLLVSVGSLFAVLTLSPRLQACWTNIYGPRP